MVLRHRLSETLYQVGVSVGRRVVCRGGCGSLARVCVRDPVRGDPRMPGCAKVRIAFLQNRVRNRSAAR